MSLGEQINFVEQIERSIHDERHKAIAREHYRLWLQAPDLYIVPDEQREKMKSYPQDTVCDIYSATLHYCEENNGNHRIWLNVGCHGGGRKEFWVINSKYKISGENCDVCPYCGANLREGEGRIALEKSVSRAGYYAEKSVLEYYGLDDIRAMTA